MVGRPRESHLVERIATTNHSNMRDVVAFLDNHGMGSIFEERFRRFNEENNEEASEHWTQRAAVGLMARLLFLPIANKIKSGTYVLYDGAWGTRSARAWLRDWTECNNPGASFA